ncbi:retrotransposon protein, putative, ty1-copia subclass [Tanacetum coccineum]
MSLNSFTSALEAGSEPTLWHHWIGTIPYDMIQELRSMFEKQAGVEKFDLIQSFHACKQEEGKSVADYVLKMKGYVEQLEQQEVKIHAMLIEYEKGLPKKVETPQVMMIKSDEEEASWSASFSGIEWKLNQKILYLYVAMVVVPQVEAIGSFDLVLPLWPCDLLDICHYAPTITRGVVFSVSRLVDNGLFNVLRGLWNFSFKEDGEAVDLEEIQEEEDSNTFCFKITGKITSRGGGFEHTRGSDSVVDSESNKWIDAMNAEIQSMMDNMVWVLVDLPPGCKTVGSRWLFKKKTDMDGIVHVYKARLVAKGYTQLYGVDYEETFSPVADIRAIRILISIAAYYDYEIWQMDVKTAFLMVTLLEYTLILVQPEGFVDPNHPRKVCKLQRSIYGLKQASRSWNKRFDEEIKRFGFTQNLDEPCVYQKASGSNVTFLILYVDDIIIMGNHIPRSIMYAVRCTRPDVAFAQNMTSRFQQNLGEPHWTALKNILKYLRKYKDMFLSFGGKPSTELELNVLRCWIETDRDDTKSQTGYVSVLEGGAGVGELQAKYL